MCVCICVYLCRHDISETRWSSVMQDRAGNTTTVALVQPTMDEYHISWFVVRTILHPLPRKQDRLLVRGIITISSRFTTYFTALFAHLVVCGVEKLVLGRGLYGSQARITLFGHVHTGRNATKFDVRRMRGLSLIRCRCSGRRLMWRGRRVGGHH